MQLWEKIKENRLLIGGLALLVVTGISYKLFFTEKEEVLLPLSNPSISVEEENEGTSTVNEVSTVQWIVVDVKGAVRQPGVYELVVPSRVIDAIQAAGGLTEQADLGRVNQAAFLVDAQVVYIPTVGEESSVWEGQQITTMDGKGIDDGLIDLNTATDSMLQTLPGIGPSKAQAIIRYREEHGAFKDVNELLNVSGIGQKTLEKLLPLITIR